MIKKKGLLGLLLVMLFSVVVVYAAEAINKEQFKEKMEAMGYEVDVYEYLNAADASKGEDEDYVSISFQEYDSVSEAKKAMADAYKTSKEAKEKIEEEAAKEDINYSINMGSANVDEDTDSKTGYISVEVKASKGNDEYHDYAYMYRIDNTIIEGSSENKEVVIDAMKELGYYSSSSWVIFVVIGVFAVIVAVVVAIVVMSKKKKNNMNGMAPNNGMNYGQPMNNMNPPMNNFNQQPTNNMNPPMNDLNQQPMNNMNPPMNDLNQQPTNNMNPPMNDLNQQPMNNGFMNVDNNQMNNNFPNMN